jgi:hypothetical protein
MCSSYKSEVYFNGLTPLDGKIAIKLKVYKGSIRHHMIKNGMFNEFAVTDPASLGTIDTLRYHSKITKEQMAAHVSTLIDGGDPYILHNLAFSGAHIRASLSPEMLGKLLREVDIDASGPESFAALMRVVHSDSYPAMQKIKRKLESIKLSHYKGEDVEECCDDILTCCDQLDAAGAFVPDFLCTIVQIFEGCSDHRLMTWAMARYEVTSKRVRYLHSMQMGVEASDSEHYANLCSDVTTQWRSQTDSNRWTVTGGKTKNVEPVLPAGYLGGCAPTNADASSGIPGLSAAQFQAFTAAMIKQVTFASRNTGANNGHNNTTGNCHSCGKSGHLARNCPTGTGGSSTNPNRPAWKNTLESGDDPDTATRTMHGRLYKWCSECGFFIFHHKAGHAAWLIRRANATGTGTGTSSGTGTSPSTGPAVAAAALAGLTLDTDDGITNFFG